MSSAVLSGTKAEIVTEHVIEIISDSGEGAQTCGQMFADLCAKNGNGIWTDVSGQITFMIYAAPTPEPSAVYLLGLGILFGSIAFRSRHNQK